MNEDVIKAEFIEIINRLLRNNNLFRDVLIICIRGGQTLLISRLREFCFSVLCVLFYLLL